MALVIGLIIIASVLQIKKNTLNLTGGRTVVTLNSKEIVQATAISSESVDQQVAAFDQKQQQIKQEIKYSPLSRPLCNKNGIFFYCKFKSLIIGFKQMSLSAFKPDKNDSLKVST